MTLHIDFETRSTLDLKEVGLWNYARHPSTDIWCAGYSLAEDDEPRILSREPVVRGRHNLRAHGVNPDFREVFRHVHTGGRVVAHNASFELAIWNNICVPRYGWPELKPEQTFCTMAQAHAMSLPGNLGDAAHAMGLHVEKDVEGHSLMLRMCRPRRYEACRVCQNGVVGNVTKSYCAECYGTGKKPIWWDDPDKLKRLYEYCRQDVRVERELHKRLMPLSAKERAVWLLDYKINQRGVAIDVPSVKAGIDLAEKVKATYDARMSEITGGQVANCNALIALKEWLSDKGYPQFKTGLAKADVATALERTDLEPVVREAITLRSEAAKASAAKLDKMLALAGDDNRLHNMFQYHGAGTGRWAGRGVQPHNLPRDLPKPAVVERVLELVRAGDADAIDVIYGSPVTMLSRCIRGLFIAPPGKVLCGGDYSGIEGRGGAYLAGEEWKLRAFREADAGTGPGIYELAYAKAFHVPVGAVEKESAERQIGKVMELLLLFGGGVGALRRGGKAFVVPYSDATLDEWKAKWRAAHPRVKQLWRDLEKAAIAATTSPGIAFTAGSKQVKFKKVGSFLWCLLPSDRALCYPYPKLMPGQYGEQLTYMAVPSQDDRKNGKIVEDPANTATWARLSTYGGSLLENVTQAICRDILAEALLRLDAAGFSPVLHVHDEIVAEEEMDRAEEMTRLVSVVPAWATGFPISVKCHSMTRYGK